MTPTTETTPQTETQEPQGTPVTIPTERQLRATRAIFDLKSKGEVELVKVSEFTPVSSIEEGLAALQNDANAILGVFNAGYKEYLQSQLKDNSTVSWKVSEIDEETGEESLSDFDGYECNPDRWKNLQSTVVNLARTLFGYSKVMVPGNKEEHAKAKRESKAQALAMILSTPAAIEGLKK